MSFQNFVQSSGLNLPELTQAGNEYALRVNSGLAEVGLTGANSGKLLLHTDGETGPFIRFDCVDGSFAYLRGETGSVIRVEGDLDLDGQVLNPNLYGRTPTAVTITTADAGTPIIALTDTSATRVILLSDSDKIDGKWFLIKDESMAAGAGGPSVQIGIQPESGTIDGKSSNLYTTPGFAVMVYSDGTNWFSSLSNYYYEENLVTNWSGIWASPQAGTMTITKVGKTVTIQVGQVLATANTASRITNTVALPNQYRPASGNRFGLCHIDDNSTFSVGRWGVDKNTGLIEIGVGANNNTFAGAGNSGWLSLNFSYNV